MPRPKGSVNIPDWTRYTRVDTMIECYKISPASEQALNEAMPNAYGGVPPGEDDWPEPDAARDADYKLSVIWNKLSPDVRNNLTTAYEAN